MQTGTAFHPSLFYGPAATQAVYISGFRIHWKSTASLEQHRDIPVLRGLRQQSAESAREPWTLASLLLPYCCCAILIQMNLCLFFIHHEPGNV